MRSFHWFGSRHSPALRRRACCRGRVLQRPAWRLFLERLEARVVPGFIDGLSYNVGEHPSAVAVGDFTGDGISDLAVANPDSYKVSVLLGNGDGTFQPAVNYAVVDPPLSVAVGDFAGNGILDLAVATVGHGNISVLMGNGDGTFRPAVNYPAGSEPVSVAVGDFNGDGILDLAVADNFSNSVSVLLGHGDGSFQAPVSYAVGRFPRSVAVGDFTGDGLLDLAVANYQSSNVSVLMGNGDGTFRPAVNYSVGSEPLSVAVGDFTGDGTAGLAVANFASNNVSLLLGNGDGTFGPAVNYAVGHLPTSVAVGDFNGDGISDLAVVNWGNDPNFLDGRVTLLLANGGGSFQARLLYVAGAQPHGVAVGDFNGDGRSDLAVANWYSGDVSVLLSNGDGSFQAPASYAGVGLVPRSVAVGDFNGDGIPDLAVGGGVLLGNGDGTFQPPVNYDAAGNAVAVADFNGDRILDIAVAGDSGVDVLLGRGDGTFLPRTHYGTGEWDGLAVGDVNGDGILDLVGVVNFNADGSEAVLLGNGDGTFRGGWTGPVGNITTSVAVGDFRGAGVLDLAVVNNNFFGGLPTVSIFRGNGDGTFQAPQSYLVGDRPEGVVVGDFNGDGIPDLAVASQGSGTVSILLGDGDGTFQPSVAYASGGMSISLAAADFNDDGILDLAVVQNHSMNGGPNLGILLGNGNGTFQPAIPYRAGEDPWSVAAGDFNGDGFRDLAVANNSVGTATVLLNDGVWPPSPGGRPGPAPGRRASKGIPTDLSASPVSITVAFKDLSRALPSTTETWPPARTLPAIPAPLADSLFAAPVLDDPAKALSTTPRVHHLAANDDAWLPLVFDRDGFEQALADLPRVGLT